jgi:uncharacterized protein YbaA (DUF1428 family)
MERYVDAFVIPIEKDKLDKYLESSERAGQIWKEHGALAYVECIGDDLEVEALGMGTFNQMAKTTDKETVIFSWIVYESKEHRDQVNKAVMADPHMDEMEMLFDVKRMAFGGFRTIVNL